MTPNRAFDTKEERYLTFIVTNVALQWQKFNGGNWAAVESAVKEYVEVVKHGVYVFTGTGKFTTKFVFTSKCIAFSLPETMN